MAMASPLWPVGIWEQQKCFDTGGRFRGISLNVDFRSSKGCYATNVMVVSVVHTPATTRRYVRSPPPHLNEKATPNFLNYLTVVCGTKGLLCCMVKPLGADDFCGKQRTRLSYDAVGCLFLCACRILPLRACRADVTPRVNCSHKTR